MWPRICAFSWLWGSLESHMWLPWAGLGICFLDNPGNKDRSHQCEGRAGWDGVWGGWYTCSKNHVYLCHS